MNRVIRQPSSAAAPLLFDGSAPAFLDRDAEEQLARAAEEAYRRGHADGMVAGRLQVTNTVDRLQAAVAGAVEELRRMHAANAAAAVEMALEIAELVIGHAAHDDGRALAERVHQALATLDDPELELLAHPDDRAVLEQALAGNPAVTVSTDPRLEPGEARLRGRWASADLTREAALAAVREALL